MAFNRRQKRALQRKFERDSKSWPEELKLVDSGDLPEGEHAGLIELWRSSDYLVQVHEHNEAVLRVSIATADRQKHPDRLTWPTLQRLKREIGRGDWEAVEIYPADNDQVNVDDMRHLWVFKDGMKLPFGFGPMRGRSKKP
jgi:hypothetical protein